VQPYVEHASGESGDVVGEVVAEGHADPATTFELDNFGNCIGYVLRLVLR
jgi:hypothetical protein